MTFDEQTVSNMTFDEQTTKSIIREKIMDPTYSSFTGDDVNVIVSEFRQEIKTNQLLKRVMYASLIVAVMLLTSVLGLSYAVATLTSNTSVNSQTGVLTTFDGKHVIATDSVSYKFVAARDEETGVQYLDAFEFAELLGRVLNGNSVTLEMIGTGENGSQTEVDSLSGSMEADNGQVCFTTSSGTQICAESTTNESGVSGRHLQEGSYVDTCLAVYAAYSSMPTIFGYMVSSASTCISLNCPGDIISAFPPIYAGTECVCECAEDSGVEFVWSWSST